MDKSFLYIYIYLETIQYLKLFLDVIQFLHNLIIYCLYILDLLLLFSFLSNLENHYRTKPDGMRRRSDVSNRPHIGWDVADQAEMSSRLLNRHVNETDLFETSLRYLTGI